MVRLAKILWFIIFLMLLFLCGCLIADWNGTCTGLAYIYDRLRLLLADAWRSLRRVDFRMPAAWIGAIVEKIRTLLPN